MNNFEHSQPSLQSAWWFKCSGVIANWWTHRQSKSSPAIIDELFCSGYQVVYGMQTCNENDRQKEGEQVVVTNGELT